MNEKLKDIFVSVAVCCDGTEKLCETVNFCSDFLRSNYAHYEILLLNARPWTAEREEELDGLLKSIPKVRYIRTTAVESWKVIHAAALENAIGDVIVLAMPNQLNEHNLSEGIRLCCEGNDIVAGVYCGSKPLMYGICSKLFRLVLGKMVDYNLPEHDSYFRCVSRRAANAVMTTARFHRFLFMRMANSGYQTQTFELLKDEKVGKEYNLRRSISEATSIVVFNSVKPLRCVSFAAVGISFVSVLIGVYSVLIRLFKQQVVEGWTTLMLVLSVMMFFMFVFVAIFGEYLRRLIADRENTAYNVVQERHSSVMLDISRLNIRESSTSEYVNLTQTGRDR